MRVVLLCLAIVCAVNAAPPPKSVKAVPLKVDGDTVTVVKSFPITITAATGAGYYSWRVPVGVVAEEAFNVLTVKSAPKGSHRITVDAISAKIGPDKVTVEFTVDRGETTLNVGDVPIPPGPIPPVPPTPPTPDPTVKGPLRVLIVFEEEEASTYPKEQHSILYGKRFADHLNSLTDEDPTMKRKRWNIWDRNTNTIAVPKDWQDAMKKPTGTLPYLLMFGDEGAVYHEGPLPKTVDEAIATVSKYAPKKGVK